MARTLAGASVLLLVHALGENSASVYSESQIEDEVSANSLCLLQKDLTVSGKQPPHYDGPYLNPDGLDSWEKEFIDDAHRGPFFKDTVSKTTTVPETPTIAPSAIPVDSVAAPAPVPAPEAEAEYKDSWRSISWSTALFGLVALSILFFHLVNLQSHKGCQMTIQTSLSNMGAFFIAKLMFAATCLFTTASLEAGGFKEATFEDLLTKEPHWQMCCVSLVRAAVIYVLTQGIIYVLCYSNCYRERTVTCITSIGSPLLGFALIDVCGLRLRFNDTNEDRIQYVLVAVFCALCLAAFLALHAVIKRNRFSENFFGPLADDVEGSSQEHYKQDTLDLENTCFGMVSGFLAFKVVERVVLGEQAIARGPLGTQTLHETTGILTVGVILAASILAVHILRMEFWSAWRNSLVEGSLFWYLMHPLGIHPRILDWAEGCCLMSAVWCIYSGISWTFTSGDFQRGLLQTGFTGAALFTAFAASVFVLIMSVIVGIWIGAGGPPQLHHHGTAGRYSYWLFVLALGLLGGLAWATCFIHAARDLALNFSDHKQLVEGILCMALGIFVLPAWVLLMLPPRKPAGDEVVVVTKTGRGLLAR